MPPDIGATTARRSVRDGLDRLHSWVVRSGLASRVGAVVIALVLAIPLFRAAGVSPWSAYKAIWDGAVGSQLNFGNALARVDLYLLLGVGIAAAFRARIYNIGAEGQLYVGALAATAFDLHVSGPSAVMVPAGLLAASLAGAAWSLVAGVLRTRLRVNVLISTLMLNYIGILLVGVMVAGPLAKPGLTAQSPVLPAAAQMWHLLPGSQIYAGIVFALAAVGGMWVVMTKTTFGYELRALGGNPEAARHAGLSEERITLKVMALSGGLAGMAGGVLLIETVHYLADNISTNFGYTAIAVALLGGLRPAGVAAAGLLFGLLEVGATQMEYQANVPATTANMIEGLIVIIFLASPLLIKLWRRIRYRKPATPLTISADTLEVVELTATESLKDTPT